jgi:hypothetical protein
MEIRRNIERYAHCSFPGEDEGAALFGKRSRVTEPLRDWRWSSQKQLWALVFGQGGWKKATKAASRTIW